MAGINLPKLMVMKPAGNYRYAGYTDGGDVFCQEDKAVSPRAKIEVEWAGDGENVHLRFYHSNKYWAQSTVGNWIVAISNQREEDATKLGCTLFKPTFVHKEDGINNILLQLAHVQSEMRVRVDSRSNRVYVGDDGDDADPDAFSFVDRDSLLKIPKRVTFKVAANYLEAVGDGTWDLQFSGLDGKGKNAAFVVHWQPDGHLRLESELLTGKFWRRTSPDNWILLATAGAVDANTLFWPQKIDSSTISLVGVGNVFCGRMSKIGANFDCFNAAAAVSYVTDKARLVVEELVLNRNISDLQYQTQDARVFDELPNLSLGECTSYNPSDKRADVTVTIPYQDATSYYFTNDFLMNTQVPFVIQARIPTIINANADPNSTIIDISGDEVTIESFLWNKKFSPALDSQQITHTVPNVPPRTTVTVKYLATLGKCSVPFTYTQKDQDIVATTSTYHDGIFYGSNHYSYHFETTLGIAVAASAAK